MTPANGLIHEIQKKAVSSKEPFCSSSDLLVGRELKITFLTKRGDYVEMVNNLAFKGFFSLKKNIRYRIKHKLDSLSRLIFVFNKFSNYRAIGMIKSRP